MEIQELHESSEVEFDSMGKPTKKEIKYLFQEKENEQINSLEVEESKKMSYCPKCKQDVVFIKSTEFEKSKLFLVFTTFSVVWILLVRMILFISNSLKKNKLSGELKEVLNNENFCFLNIYFPKTIKINCKNCNYEFFNNYSKKDVKIIAFVFFFIVISVLMVVFYVIRK